MYTCIDKTIQIFRYFHQIPPRVCTLVLFINESTEVQTLGAIRIQLYHQCFEQVWQHNFTSVFEGRHNAIDLRWSAHRSSIFESRHIDLRRSTHRSLKIEGGNIAPTTQHRADIPTIRHRILSTARSIIIIPKILRGIYILYI